MTPGAVRILIFEQDATGHQVDCIRRLLAAIERQVPGAQVILMVSPEAAAHPNCQRVAGMFNHFVTLRVVPRFNEGFLFFRQLGTHFEAQWQNAEMFQRAFADLGPDAVDFVLLPHLESLGLLQLGLRRNLFRGKPWATISVGTRFHHRKAGIAGPTRWIDKVQQAFFWRVVRDRTLACFGTIDPFLVPIAASPKVVHCPDPCEPPVLAAPEQARAAYGVRAETCVVLVFGFIDVRKCLHTLIEGAARVAPDVDLTILIAGPQYPRQAALLRDNRAARQLRERGRLVEINRFILSGQDIDPMSAADIAWVFYGSRFVYSSSVLVRSALSGKAVICRRQGVTGRQVEEHQCGLALPTGAPDEVAAALTRLATDPALRRRMGENGARAFAGHTPEAFAQPIVDSILRSTA